MVRRVGTWLVRKAMVLLLPMDRPGWDHSTSSSVGTYPPLLESLRAEPPEVRTKQVLQGGDFQRVPYSTGVMGRAGMASWV